MKKSLFNKSAVALAAGLFVVGVANAYVVGPAAATMVPAVGGTTQAINLVLNPRGIGHQLFVPYYTAQDGLRTYLTLVNTDMRNGKATKVRFRGASNSDDVLDFTVFLSPGDTWTAVVYAPSQANPARIEVVEGDTTCTAPAIPAGGVEFRTFRLHQQLTASLQTSETREGYIEIFNEADIPPALSTATGAPTLYQAINHSATGAAPTGCDAVRNTLLTSIARVTTAADPRPVLAATFTSVQDMAMVNDLVASTYADAQGRGFEVPSTGLMASWAIASPATGRAWSGNAVAVEGQLADGTPGYGNIIYHPQRGDAVTVEIARQRTADPLLRGGVTSNNVAPVALATCVVPCNPFISPANVNNVSPTVAPLSVDLPDMSTPYLNAALTGGTLPITNLGIATRTQAQSLTAALAASSVSNEILTLGSGRTDWTFTFPTRRYNVARSYLTTGTNTEGNGTTLYTDYRIDDGGTAIATGRNYFNPNNIASDTATGRRHQLCVSGIAFNGGAKGGVMTTLPRHSGVTANRDEWFSTVSGAIDFSPAPPAGAVAAFCGESGVFSFNRASIPTGVLNAAVAPRDFNTSGRPYGWMRFQTLGLARGAGGIAAQIAATTPGITNADGLGLPVVGLAFWTFENMSIAFPHRAN